MILLGIKSILLCTYALDCLLTVLILNTSPTFQSVPIYLPKIQLLLVTCPARRSFVERTEFDVVWNAMSSASF
jgi:hypothetical protein